MDTLTPEQERLLDVYFERWLAIGLDCAPADFKAGMKALDCLYERTELKRAPTVVAYASPYAMLHRPETGVKLRGRRKTWPTCPDLSNCMFGQHMANWAGFYSYMREVLGAVEETEVAVGNLLELPKHIGWACMYEEVIYVTGKTTAVRLNADGGLHAEDGPAIEYADGFGIYAVDDVVVPDEWVKNKAALDPDLAFTWPNVEQRAVAGRLIGWDRVLAKAGRTVIDSDPNKYVGTLVEALVGGLQRRFLEVECPTGRQMVLSVPPGMRTAAEANNWTYSDAPSVPVIGEGRT